MVAMATDVDLMAIPEEEFRAVVDAAVRGHLDVATIEKLKSPEVVERSYLTLISMKKNVEGQLAAKRADYVKSRSQLRNKMGELQDAEERYQTWRAGALRFKSGVEEFMVSIRSRRERPGVERDYYIPFQTLKHAILQHRDHICDADCETECTADVNLWAIAEDMS